MKKITKILALTLALVMLALSCTSCGKLFDSSIFISKKEKEQMASNILEHTLIERGKRKISDKTYTFIVEDRLEEFGDVIECIRNYDKMTVTLITNNLNGSATSSDGTPADAVVKIKFPYKIKSVTSKTAIEKEIEGNCITLIYSSENKKLVFGCFGINDEIVIKYTK